MRCHMFEAHNDIQQQQAVLKNIVCQSTWVTSQHLAVREGDAIQRNLTRTSHIVFQAHECPACSHLIRRSACQRHRRAKSPPVRIRPRMETVPVNGHLLSMYVPARITGASQSAVASHSLAASVMPWTLINCNTGNTRVRTAPITAARLLGIGTQPVLLVRAAASESSTGHLQFQRDWHQHCSEPSASFVALSPTDRPPQCRQAGWTTPA